MLATSTVRATDLGDAGGAISVVELSTGKSLGSIKVSNKASPARDAPVEILFAPGSNPPAAYVTNMYGGTLWLLRWNAQTKDFDPSQVFDFATVKSGVPWRSILTVRRTVSMSPPRSPEIYTSSM